MNEPLIVVYPRGQLSAKDKERLTKHGILAIEADDPKAVVQLRLSNPLTCNGLRGDDIVESIFEAIAEREPKDSSGYLSGSGAIAHAIIKKLSARMKAASDAQKAAP